MSNRVCVRVCVLCVWGSGWARSEEGKSPISRTEGFQRTRVKLFHIFVPKLRP